MYTLCSCRQMQQVLDDPDTDVGPGEEHLAALTAHDRVSWAVAREQYFSKGVNRENMAVIEQAAYIIFYDDSIPDVSNKVGIDWALVGSESTLSEHYISSSGSDRSLQGPLSWVRPQPLV